MCFFVCYTRTKYNHRTIWPLLSLYCCLSACMWIKWLALTFWLIVFHLAQHTLTLKGEGRERAGERWRKNYLLKCIIALFSNQPKNHFFFCVHFWHLCTPLLLLCCKCFSLPSARASLICFRLQIWLIIWALGGQSRAGWWSCRQAGVREWGPNCLAVVVSLSTSHHGWQIFHLLGILGNATLRYAHTHSQLSTNWTMINSNNVRFVNVLGPGTNTNALTATLEGVWCGWLGLNVTEFFTSSKS